MARAGWAIVLTKQENGVMVRVGSILGHLPGWVQDNYRAVVYALTTAIWHGVDRGCEGCSVDLVTDCRGGTEDLGVGA